MRVLTSIVGCQMSFQPHPDTRMRLSCGPFVDIALLGICENVFAELRIAAVGDVPFVVALHSEHYTPGIGITLSF